MQVSPTNSGNKNVQNPGNENDTNVQSNSTEKLTGSGTFNLFGLNSNSDPGNTNFLNLDPKLGAAEKNLIDRNGILQTRLNNSFNAVQPTAPARFNYNSIQGIANNRFVTPGFLSGVEDLAQKIGTRPEYLLSIMSFETGGTFDPAKTNSIGATGLIQFLPGTADGLGTSTADLANMSSTDQLKYVEKYFNQPNFQGKLGTLEGLYTAVLSGRAHSNSDDVLFKSGTKAYQQNPLDWNKDGEITAGEAVTPVAARMYGGVRAVQQRLIDAGYVPDDQQKKFADGVWGANTADALQKFQTANNLPATGLLNDATGRALFNMANPAPIPPAAPANDIKRGSTGTEVANLQDNLIKLGYLTAAQKATGPGIFGTKTENALKSFQRDVKLPVSGALDSATRNALQSVNSGLGRNTENKNQTVTKGIQDRLVALGVLTQKQVNTGYGRFGPQTEAAVKRFQSKNSLPQDGNVNDKTFKQLFSNSANSGANTGSNYSTAVNGRNYTVNSGILMTDALRPRLQDLADRYHQQTGGSLRITSGYRPPSRQASAMYDLIAAHGTDYVRNLYANKTAVDQVLTAYRNNSGSRSAAVAAMTQAVETQVNNGTYISSHLRNRAMDIGTEANLSTLRQIVGDMGGTVLNEGNHYHVQL